MKRSWILILSFVGVLTFSSVGQAAFHGHVSIVNSVVYSADGKWALSGSWDWTMQLWDLSTQKPIRKFKDHVLSVNQVSFSPDGKLALSASADATLKLWNISDGKPLNTFKGHTGIVTTAAFTPDGNYILS